MDRILDLLVDLSGSFLLYFESDTIYGVIMAESKFDEAIAELDQAGASMRCSSLSTLLIALGFEVKDGKRGGHKVFTHDHNPGFYSAAYNCDHGKNPEIKRPYINKVKKTLKQHESAIRAYLKQQ